MRDGYANELLRGLPNKECVTEEGYITEAAFRFLKNPKREDDLHEVSINWYDDDNAIAILQNQFSVKRGENQFIGYVQFSRHRIDDIMSIYDENSHFSYERREEAISILKDKDVVEISNEYHGNLLAPGSIDPQIKKVIQNTLATIASHGKIEFWNSAKSEKEHF